MGRMAASADCAGDRLSLGGNSGGGMEGGAGSGPANSGGGGDWIGSETAGVESSPRISSHASLNLSSSAYVRRQSSRKSSRRSSAESTIHPPPNSLSAPSNSPSPHLKPVSERPLH